MNKKKVLLLLSGVFCLGLCPAAISAEKEWVNSADLSDWEGMVQLNTQGVHSGSSSFELYGTYPTELISSRMIPIDPAKTYTFSAWMRSLDDATPASSYMGLRLYDENKREITVRHITPFPNTETTLAADVAQGATELWVYKKEAWLERKTASIALNAQEDYSDLPNFEISPRVKELIDEGDRYRILLHGSIAKDYPALTPVRLHSPWGAPMYHIVAGWREAQWTAFTNVIKGEAVQGMSKDQFWPGTQYVRPFIWFGNWNRIPEKDARLLIDDIHFTERIVQEGVQ